MWEIKKYPRKGIRLIIGNFFDPDVLTHIYGPLDMIQKVNDMYLNTKEENCVMVTDNLVLVS